MVSEVGTSPELAAHYARYLCVLVAGHAEQSVKELVTHFARKRSSPEVLNYVSSQLKFVRNVDQEKLRQLLQSLDPGFWDSLAAAVPDDLEALTSTVTVRNGVAHGTESGITYSTIKQYYERVSSVLDRLCDLLDPVDDRRPRAAA
jgi:hypothetical protein